MCDRLIWLFICKIIECNEWLNVFLCQLLNFKTYACVIFAISTLFETLGKQTYVA